ncbi:hypothetical protein, conserved [Eimeria brunetti]|uniref:Uncharacterized protein n=1 Tax=Eimeria brunetti TaxID=51314 RepID=U6M1I0_9EIME|nr:hypothetical protein, conserved [Eimeria brunetti]
MGVLHGGPVQQLPRVPKQLLLQQQQQQQQQQLLQQHHHHHQQHRAGHRNADAADPRPQSRGPQTLDGYRIHYPAAADAATAAAAAAAVPMAAAEAEFLQQLQKANALISECTLTIRDAQDSRRRQAERVFEVQQLLQRVTAEEAEMQTLGSEQQQVGRKPIYGPA